MKETQKGALLSKTGRQTLFESSQIKRLKELQNNTQDEKRE